MAYELDVDTLALQIAFEEAGLETVAIYHSHPRGRQRPRRPTSARDLPRMSFTSSAAWPTATGPVLRGFVISGDGYLRGPHHTLGVTIETGHRRLRTASHISNSMSVYG